MRRRLDAELVRRGLARSRADALAAVAEGRVRVAGSVASSAARLVDPGESLDVRPEDARYVSRGGHKLAAALAAFPIAVAGLRWLDAGASTGGFTDCLLQAGASGVVCVDVGHGQLAWSLRSDARVHSLERTNVRALGPADIGGTVDSCVADVSFISLRTIAPALMRCTEPSGDFVLLVKPQFEAGPSRVGKGGVVRDPAVHEAVLVEVVADLAEQDLGVTGLIASPLLGADGNREFLAHARRAAEPLGAASIARIVHTPPAATGQNDPA